MKVHIMSFLFTQFGSIDYSEQEIDRCIGILKVHRAPNEGSGRIHNHGEGPVPILHLLTIG